jgi:hypothetical protein
VEGVDRSKPTEEDAKLIDTIKELESRLNFCLSPGSTNPETQAIGLDLLDFLTDFYDPKVSTPGTLTLHLGFSLE